MEWGDVANADVKVGHHVLLAGEPSAKFEGVKLSADRKSAVASIVYSCSDPKGVDVGIILSQWVTEGEMTWPYEFRTVGGVKKLNCPAVEQKSDVDLILFRGTVKSDKAAPQGGYALYFDLVINGQLVSQPRNLEKIPL
ncbi:hypothetical protein [Streptomyces sirii]|uniref:hypothetical protein n=1 Tax=Streptomyces sirii TaxID=3127701 RepID=UPI003D36D979